ncbi:unnamed protein product, partial [Thlaspi arvense]
ILRFETEDVVKQFIEYLKISENEAKALFLKKSKCKSYSIDTTKLKSHFEKVSEDNDDQDLEPYFIAYLLIMLGIVVNPNNTRGISAMFLPLLVKKINKYAWGTTMFDVLKTSVDAMKKKLLKKITTTLCVFALKRFRVFVSYEVKYLHHLVFL